MKPIKESAEEYAVPGRASGTEAIRKRAYLAGARAAMKMAAHKAAQKTAMFPSDSDYTRGYAIARSDMCNEIRALLPTEWPQMYKGLEQDFSTPETEVVPGAFSPDHFESWLASKPRGESYDWLGVCLYQQYGEYCGLGIGNRAYLDAVAAIKAHTNQPLGGEPFRFVASERPHTFGGALRRLRTQRHGLFGAARLYFREWRAASSRLAALQGKG